MAEKKTFNDLINSPDQPVLVDFFATWCGPCKAMGPILGDVVSQVKGEAKVIKIDIDKNPDVARKYQVRSVPTLMVFLKGEPVWRQSGVVPASHLVQVLDQVKKEADVAH